ncbi:sulfatase-like hydrolase/transferase [Lentisphaera marina]|uniref:sulfatase-like hydrolase/transferase n=1 Tax=Lentisphaera marina TaxID=1111041 RepID=UPI0023657D98|nr:sulfatase-like hydrolase/transferase [Lentisphaera marina]MDD7986198.1 sulfatase-like hydrolase/transferase [Lentisphaera marina]
MITQKITTMLTVAVLAFAGQLFAAEGAAEKPNVMFIFADDQTYESIGAYGQLNIKTPNLDRLVKRGVSFTHTYNMGAWGGAVCVASRAMLNSGRFVNRAEQGVKQYPHWSEIMNGAGYTTYMTGKWHVPGKPRFNVTKNVRGGMPNQADVRYRRTFKPELYESEWLPWDERHGGFWTGGTHWTQVVADDTLKFFDKVKNDDKPFFMYLAFNAPHDPRQAPKEYVDMYPLDSIKIPKNYLPEYPYAAEICGKKLRDEILAPYPRTEYAVKRNRQEYYASITYMDHHIGRMLDALEASGKADNTYIIFTADHGLAAGHHGLMGKQSMYEHSMRPPFIVVGPGIKPNSKIDTPIYLQDAMATAIELAGAEKPAHVEFKSLMPLIKGEKTVQYDRIYGKYMNTQRMILKDDWKLIFYPTAAKKMRLFNIKNDPAEMNDLIDNPEYATKIKELKSEFAELKKEMGDPLSDDKLVRWEDKHNKGRKVVAPKPTRPRLDASVSASANTEGNHSPKTLVDGNYGTKYYHGKVTFPASFVFSLKGSSMAATTYTIVSANDMPERDPKSWELLGSNDGKKWTSLDKRTDEEFSSRLQARDFTIATSQSFSNYKLVVTESVKKSSGLQFAEIHLGTK